MQYNVSSYKVLSDRDIYGGGGLLKKNNFAQRIKISFNLISSKQTTLFIPLCSHFRYIKASSQTNLDVCQTGKRRKFVDVRNDQF